MISAIKRFSWWAILCGILAYLCLESLPAIARNLSVGRMVFLPLASLLTAILVGHLLVIKSKSEDCWYQAALFGAFVYAAIVAALAMLMKAIVLPVPYMFVLPGCALGGLLRWHQLQPKPGDAKVADTA